MGTWKYFITRRSAPTRKNNFANRTLAQLFFLTRLLTLNAAVTTSDNIKNNSRKPPKYKPPLKILNGGLRLLFVDRRLIPALRYYSRLVAIRPNGSCGLMRVFLTLRYSRALSFKCWTYSPLPISVSSMVFCWQLIISIHEKMVNFYGDALLLSVGCSTLPTGLLRFTWNILG